MKLTLTRCAALLFLTPVLLQAALPRRTVKVAGLPAGASTGTAAAWHWVEGSGREGGRALRSGETAGEGSVSWLEMQVRGPDRLYFSCRTDYERLTMIFPDLGDYITHRDIYPVSAFADTSVRYGSTAHVGMGTAVTDFDSRPTSLGYSINDLIYQNVFAPRPAAPALRFWLGRNELTLPAVVTEATQATTAAECLTNDMGWSEYRISIPRGVHRVRWEFDKATPLAKATLLDGVRLESGAAVTITSPRSATLCAGQSCRVAVLSNHRGRTFSALGLPDGLSLDAASGLLTGTVVEPGIYHTSITARDTRRSSHTIPLRLEVQADAGKALDEPRLVWKQGHDDSDPALPCSVEVAEAPDGIDALRINSAAWLETEVTGPDKLSFAWRPQFDRWSLELSLDGLAVALPEQATSGWQRQSLDIPAGRHRVRWRSLERFDSGYWYGGRQGTITISMSDNYVTNRGWPVSGWSSVLIDDVMLESRPRPMLERPPIIVAAAESEFVQRLAVTGAVDVTASGLPSGVTLLGSPDGLSAGLTGTPAAAGLYPVRFTATGPGGVTEVATSLQVLPPIAPALDSIGLTWRTGGTGGMAWEAVGATPHEYSRPPRDGEDALWASNFAPYDPGHEAWIETTVTGPDTLHFFWKRRDYAAPDAFQLLLDGAPVPGLVAPIFWQAASIAIPPGEHSLRWVVSADGRGGSALDQVRLASDGRAFPLSEETINCTALRPFTRALTFSRVPDSITVIGDLPPGLTLSESGVLSGAASTSGSWHLELTTYTAVGTVSGRITIQAAPPCLPDWLAAKHLTGAGLASDTDGDGLTLFMEFALGGDPAKPDFNFSPKLSFHEHGVSWEFPRGDYDANGALVVVHYSTDLRSWLPVHCWNTTDEAGRPVHRGTLHWSPRPEKAYFRIRAEVPRPGRD